MAKSKYFPLGLPTSEDERAISVRLTTKLKLLWFRRIPNFPVNYSYRLKMYFLKKFISAFFKR